ncbi:MAG TPA: recombinase family protein [Candidatus Limiplasma sp.]|nr:recombinase family protein [Candidatus Limiplasma sp.]HPS80474.1 recombinase family protein [Candidatus Limiplasma sp.]
MKLGYARVSTLDQSLDRQIDSLNAQGCERIYQEKITGTKTHRPELDRMMETLRSGDILVVDSFSRLSRSTKDLLEMVDRLQKMNVSLISLKENLDTTTATGKLMLTMMSALSQFERDIIAERTAEGLRAARARGRLGGRPKANTKAIEQALKMYDSQKFTIREIADSTKLSTATINRRVAERKRVNA